MELEWHTSDESVASISDGKITAKAIGTATVWVEEKSKDCETSGIRK